jgi:cytochrome b561
MAASVSLPVRHHPALVALHWLAAALILFSLAMGTLSLKEIPNTSPDKLFALRGHMVLGIAILVLTVVRFGVRLGTRRPPLLGQGFLNRVAPLAHNGLYVLVVLMAASGIALALQAGLPEIVFRGAGSLPESFSAFTPRRVHGLLARLLLALIALHVAAALYHQFVRRDGLLRRMAFGKR